MTSKQTDMNDPVYEFHSKVNPIATYSPWLKDQFFCEFYAFIKQYTLVDIYRSFELWKLIEQSKKLATGDILEIGVWRGGTGALLAKQALCSDIDSTIYLCDTFTGVVKAGENDLSYKGGEHDDTSLEVVENLIYEQLKLNNVKILHGIFPDETGHEITDKSFRFCHIDVDVYQSAKDIVDWVWDKMVPGGIIVYDDYGFKHCSGITKYVEEQMLLEDRVVVHNLNGHAIVIKR